MDKIIVLSKEMELFFKDLFPDKPILFIPHGVDTTYFKPKKSKLRNILQVGNWLRDFELASKVYNYLNVKDPKLSITVITNPPNHKYFISNKNVTCVSGIKDYELLELYQYSKIVFLPLKKFTANNALIEALSCGCEVVIATNKDYFIDEDYLKIHFIESDYIRIGDYLVALLDRVNNFAEYNRNFLVKNWDWSIIGQKTKIFVKES